MAPQVAITVRTIRLQELNDTHQKFLIEQEMSNSQVSREEAVKTLSGVLYVMQSEVEASVGEALGLPQQVGHLRTIRAIRTT